MLSLCRSPICSPRTLALAAAIALSATSLHAASSAVGTKPEPPKAPKSVLDVQIPIDFAMLKYARQHKLLPC